MIEVTLLDYLNTMITEPAFMEVPDNPPVCYVILQKTGSRRENRVDTATFAIQSISDTLYEAAELNEAVKDAMDQMEARVPGIFRVELGGDYNFTNTQTKERRYQAVYNITYKE